MVGCPLNNHMCYSKKYIKFIDNYYGSNVPQDMSKNTKYITKQFSQRRIVFTGCENPPFYSEKKGCEKNNG